MEPNAVINTFSLYEGEYYLGLGCAGVEGSGRLEWEATGVERFSGIIDKDVLSENDDVTVQYFSMDSRDSLLTLLPVTSANVGYYTCRSTESGSAASVLVTFEDPYFAFTSLTEYEVPLGVRVDISARYAYSSNGLMNIGTGFLYDLTFLPCVSPTTMSPNSTDEVPTPQQEQSLASGVTNNFNNNLIYSVYASDSTGGLYNLTCKLSAIFNIESLDHIFIALCSCVHSNTGNI